MVRVGDSSGPYFPDPIHQPHPKELKSVSGKLFKSEPNDIRDDVETCYNLINTMNWITQDEYMPIIIERFEKIVASGNPRVMKEMKEQFQKCIDQYHAGRVNYDDLNWVAFDNIKKLGPCPERARVENSYDILFKYLNTKPPHKKEELKSVYDLAWELSDPDSKHKRLTRDEDHVLFEFVIAYKFGKTVPHDLLQRVLAVLEELKSREGSIPN